MFYYVCSITGGHAWPVIPIGFDIEEDARKVALSYGKEHPECERVAVVTASCLEMIDLKRDV